jgi:hypothetical protein
MQRRFSLAIKKVDISAVVKEKLQRIYMPPVLPSHHPMQGTYTGKDAVLSIIIDFIIRLNVDIRMEHVYNYMKQV